MYDMYETEPQAQQAEAETPKPRVRRSGLGTGTTSLLMIFTLLCLATLALLSLSTARSDEKIKSRGLAAAQSLSASEGAAAVKLAELDAFLAGLDNDANYIETVAKNLPDGFTAAGDIVTFTVDGWEDRILITQVRVLPPGGAARFEIVGQTQETTSEWTPDLGGGVWQG